jgi:hypothetical protein
MQLRINCCRSCRHSLLVEASPSSSTAPALHAAELS